MKNEIIQEKIDNLPLLPGVYLMKNNEGKIIYIGKAKKLKNRVPQYFLRPHEGKTQKMVSEVEDFEIIITSSEQEALILELNLVHKHTPKYNILLRDGKTFPYIEVTNDKYPCLKIARGVKKKKMIAFGPFPDSSAAYEVLDLLNSIYPLRKCEKVMKKECLYYHLHQCLGPCINEISNDDYKAIIEKIKRFLNGDIKEVKDTLKSRMLIYAENLEFERAKECKDLLDSIEYVINKQKVQFDDRVDRDVFAFHASQGYIAIAVLLYRSGVLSGKDAQVFPYIGEEEDAFVSFITQFYLNERLPKEVIIPFIKDSELLKNVLQTKINIPNRGVKLQLLQMAGQNAFKAMEEQNMIKVIKSDKLLIMEELGNLLNMTPPLRIEMIDNSHLQGADAVSAVVVFINGVPNKKFYRKYRLKGEETKDDIASMKEVLTRRYSRIKEENGIINDLLLVDGGINQLNIACKVIEELGIKIKVAGVVKDDKHHTRGLINDKGEELLITNQDILHFLTRMQDEVHRFVIEYHRNLRTKSVASSLLDQIDGIGEKRKELLLKIFGSVKKMTEAPESELAQYVPLKIAKKIKEIRINN